MEFEHYYFIGIGGIGMGALASLVLSKGAKVSGSDIKENSMVQSLRQQGANIQIGHDRNNMPHVDCVVFSSAVKEDNPEMMEARGRKIPVIKRAQLLADLMEGHIPITIAGSHGKTTTTSMISHMLIQAGLKPTTAIGGIINGASYNAKLGEGQYFVAEVDESDGSFLFFHPKYSVVTNIDYEHLDYYHNWEEIMQAYRQFMLQTDPSGVLVVCGEDARLVQLIKEVSCQHDTYGFSAECDMIAEYITPMKYSIQFDCSYKKKSLGNVILRIPGWHNVLNAMACISIGLRMGIDFSLIKQSLESFAGVNRRLQRKGCAKDIWVIDDYGHHPTEIKATLEAANLFKEKRLVTVFQPHRYSRTKYLMSDFAKSLMLSDYLVITDIYAASEPALEGVTAKHLYENVLKQGHPHVVYKPKEQILDYLMKIVETGDLVLTLGAGDIYQIGDQLLEELKKSENITSK